MSGIKNPIVPSLRDLVSFTCKRWIFMLMFEEENDTERDDEKNESNRPSRRNNLAIAELVRKVPKKKLIKIQSKFNPEPIIFVHGTILLEDLRKNVQFSSVLFIVETRDTKMQGKYPRPLWQRTSS